MKMKTDVVGKGEPLVLVPGGLTGWVSWKQHAEVLSKDYRVVRVQPLNVDLGLRRERLPDEYSVSLEVKALTAALDGEGIRDAHFVAWSFGAEVTLSFAIANPDRVRTLALIEPPAFWVLRSRGPLSPQLLDRQRQLDAMWRVDISEEQLAWFTHFAGFVPPDVDPRALPAWQGWVAHRQSLAHGDATYRHEDDIRKVREFPRPVLLFKSKDSSGFLIQIIDILAQEFHQATVHDLPGGHAMHLMNPDVFLELLKPTLR